MPAQMLSTEEYYAIWDRHTAKRLARKLGHEGAVARCVIKKWHNLEGILRNELTS